LRIALLFYKVLKLMIKNLKHHRFSPRTLLLRED